MDLKQMNGETVFAYYTTRLFLMQPLTYLGNLMEFKFLSWLIWGPAYPLKWKDTDICVLKRDPK